MRKMDSLKQAGVGVWGLKSSSDYSGRQTQDGPQELRKQPPAFGEIVSEWSPALPQRQGGQVAKIPAFEEKWERLC